MFNHLLLIINLFAISIGQPENDFLSWTKPHCKSIVKKCLQKGTESTGAAFSKGLFGQSTGMICLWLSESTAKAVARITQLEERQNEARANELFTTLRYNSSKESFAIVVFASSIRIFPGAGGIIFDANPERLAKIFLEDSEDQTKFVRAYSIEPVPFNAKEVLGRPAMFTQGFLIRFHRTRDDGTSLINNLKQKVRLRLPTDAGILRATFKLSEMGIENTETL